jgi:hypothetical protein
MRTINRTSKRHLAVKPLLILQSAQADFVCVVAVSTAEFFLDSSVGAGRLCLTFWQISIAPVLSFPQLKATFPNPEFPQLAVPKPKDRKA